jgi:hypothetical protein
MGRGAEGSSVRNHLDGADLQSGPFEVKQINY